MFECVAVLQMFKTYYVRVRVRDPENFYICRKGIVRRNYYEIF